MHEPEFKPRLTFAHPFGLLAGVILPVISITVEATTHICAETFFDPIPSLWYLMLVIFVPIAQLHVWFTIMRGSAQRLALAGWLNALVLGISLFYSFVYIPLVPLAALTLVFIVGFLPLAPFFSLVAAIVMRRQLKKIATRTPQKNFIMRTVGLFTAFLVTAVFIGVLELPASITRYGLKLAASEVPETRAEGIRFLRDFGSRDYLLRTCYGRSGWATDMFGYFITMKDPVTPTQAQEIYYRVTGETFDMSHPPRRAGGRISPEDEFNFDSDQGGTEIGGKLKGLSLANSKIYTKADANGGVAYMQWTMVFRNEWVAAREARAEIQLPPGAVVSRLTMWVNGEEREAAFAGRNKVREANQQVAIRQRRDPVLVTTSGRDRILVQCFPVPGDGGEMKIRIGITIPLLLEGLHHAQLLFPHFVDRNFGIPDEVAHSVLIESTTSMSSTSSAFTTSQFSGESFTQRGTIPERKMSNPETSIRFGRANVPTWSKDPFQTGNFIIQQTIDARGPSHLYRIVLVVDTSESMGEMRHQMVDALRSIPAEFDLKLVLADAEGLSHNHIGYNVEHASVQLDNAVFSGGADNLPALLKAWDLAAEKPGNNAIVWVHSPQLLQFQSTDALRQRWESGPYGPALYSIQTKSGSDQILKTLDGIDEVKSVPRTSHLEVDLKKLFERLTGQAKMLEFVRTSKKVAHYPDPSEAIESSDHLARLWANDEVSRILAAGDETLNNAATMLAVRYQLVTPVTGAVVLDTEEQYRATELTPLDEGTVPTIPEPGMLALLAVVTVLLSYLIYRSRRMARGSGLPI